MNIYQVLDNLDIWWVGIKEATMEYFLYCAIPAVFITAWQIIFIIVLVAIAFLAGKIMDKIFCRGK